MLRMSRLSAAFAAAFVLLLPFERPLLVGLTHVGGLGSGLLIKQSAHAQNAISFYDSGLERFKSGDYQGAVSDFTSVIKLDPQQRSGTMPVV
jgi:outer membrane protein assembly factor BamD (BamD/ComL family)